MSNTGLLYGYSCRFFFSSLHRDQLLQIFRMNTFIAATYGNRGDVYNQSVDRALEAMKEMVSEHNNVQFPVPS